MSCSTKTTFRATQKRKTAQYRGLENDVYAAYCEDDQDHVLPVINFLKEKGLLVYDPNIDGWPNESLLHAWVDRGVYNAKKTVVFLTKHFLSSDECGFQATNGVYRYTQTKGIHKHRVIVVMLQSCKMPKFLRNFNCVYAWKYKESPQAQHTRIFNAIVAPKHRFRKGNIASKNIIHSRNSSLETDEQLKKIPSVKHIVSYTDILLHLSKVKTVLEHCELHCVSEGCTFRCQGKEWKEFSQHLKICRYQVMVCRYCRHTVTRKNLKRHEQERCKHKRVPCPNEFCARLFSRREIEVHKRTCPFEEVSCPNNHYGCDHVFAKKDKNKHMEICQFVQVDCKSCKKFYFKKDIFIHRCPQAMPSHMQPPSPQGDQDQYFRPPDTFRCPHDGCKFKDIYQQLVLHDLVCEYKLSQCHDCGMRLPRKDLLWHNKECDRIIECENCHMNIPSSSKLTHDRYMCSGDNTLTLCDICHQVIDRKSKSPQCNISVCRFTYGATGSTLGETGLTTCATGQTRSRSSSETGSESNPSDSGATTRGIDIPARPYSTTGHSESVGTIPPAIMTTRSFNDTHTDKPFWDPKTINVRSITPSGRKKFNSLMKMADKNPDIGKLMREFGGDSTSFCQQSEYYGH